MTDQLVDWAAAQAEEFLRTGLSLVELYPGADRQNLKDWLSAALRNLNH